MSQRKRYSAVETVLNTASGIALSLVVWMVIVQPVAEALRWNMNDMLVHQVIAMNLLFTVVSVVRGYFWRRVFVRLGRRIMGVG